MEKHYFTKNIEKMVDPMDVGTIHFMQSYSTSLPVSIQNNMIKKGAKKNPYMGFVVEPYSFFLNYEIKDIEWARKLIPDNYELVKTKVLNSDEPKYYCIFGCFNVHSSAFWGTRMECYIIAQSKDTGLMSWIIVDYHTNTVGFDEKNGLSGGNTSECTFTTNYEGHVIVDIQGSKDNNKIIADCVLTKAKEEELCYKLWVEGNLSVSYGRELSNNTGEPFAVYFNPDEMKKTLVIPRENINIEINNWFEGLFNEEPESVICFPFAQHFLSDSPGHYSNLKSASKLNEFIENVNFEDIPKYSSKSIKRGFLIGNLVTFGIVIILLILLILK